jgi:heme-degrading monooxygenase HmoA
MMCETPPADRVRGRGTIPRRAAAAPPNRRFVCTPPFARTRPGPELADALVSNAADVKSLVSGIDGFKAYYLVRTADGAVSISVYDNEAGATESTSAAANWIRENLPELGGSAPQVSAGEVVISA